MFGTYRTLLALMVVALHLGGVPSMGGYAVFGFYALSGYLMTLIMQNNYGYTLSGVSKYAINRFLRIYPIYWISIAFSAFLILFVGEQFSSEYKKVMYFPQTPIETAKNIFLFFPFRESPRLTPPAWALTVEIFYYILIGLGLSKSKRVVLLWLSASLIYHAVAVTAGFGWEHRYSTIPAASLPYATGAFIYHYKNNVLKRIHHADRKLDEYLHSMVFFGILLNWFAGYLSGHLKGVFFYSNYILCAFMVVILSERRTLPFISRKFDKLMGDFSYPIYLIHYQVGLIVVVIFGMAGLDYKRPDLTIMLVSTPLIFIFSWIFIVAFERPIDNLRSRVKKANNRINSDT
jgi:peptidoglycan/LPS O-acetylase OafA/YrhL